MAHRAKFARAATGKLCQHYERKIGEDGKYIRFGNQDIDLSKTHQNYNLGPVHPGSQVEFIQTRCSEVKCLKRENVKVMCAWVVTAPEDITNRGYDKEFFQKTYDFLEKRYGRENVISAYVHMDENAPHMHFAFVPVVYDKKKELFKVSAKECVGLQDLKTFHTDLDQELRQTMGDRYRGGVLNGATINGNKSIRELKEETLDMLTLEAEAEIDSWKQEVKFEFHEELDELASQVKSGAEQEASVIIGAAKKEAGEIIGKAKSIYDNHVQVSQTINDEAKKMAEAVKVLETQKGFMLEEIQRLEGQIEGITLKIQEIESIRPQKGLGNSLKNITLEQVQNLKKTALTAYATHHELTRENEKLKVDLAHLSKLVPSLEDRINDARNKQELLQLKQDIKEKLPEPLQRELLRPKQNHFNRDEPVK